jgi:hypothetical protein
MENHYSKINQTPFFYAPAYEQYLNKKLACYFESNCQKTVANQDNLAQMAHLNNKVILTKRRSYKNPIAILSNHLINLAIKSLTCPSHKVEKWDTAQLRIRTKMQEKFYRFWSRTLITFFTGVIFNVFSELYKVDLNLNCSTSHNDNLY